MSALAQEAQQGIGAHRHGQASDRPLSGPAAERAGDRVAEDVEARCPPSMNLDQIGGACHRLPRFLL